MSDDQGRFIWYELLTSDVDGAKRFYGDVVGWTYEDMPGDGFTYTVASAKGERQGEACENGVAGLMAIPPEAAAQGMPPNWSGYVRVDDCDAAAAKITTLGGSVMRPPEDIPGIGRFAVVADPHGAVFEIMKPAPMENEPPRPPAMAEGHTSWHELYAGELEPAFAFYAEMFGWKKDEALDMGPMGTYQLFSNQDGQVGGMMTKPADVPRPAWAYYFQVGDIDAAVERVKAGGGQVLNGPMEVPGEAWIIQGLDPQRAMFALVGRRG